MSDCYVVTLVVLLLFPAFIFGEGQYPISEALLKILKQSAWEYSHVSTDGESIIQRIEEFEFPPGEVRSTFKDDAGMISQTSVGSEQPQVNVKNGLLIGGTNADSQAFYSIPYAKPPVGSLRFMPPEEADSFSQLNVSLPNYRKCWQIKDCNASDPQCTDTSDLSEDCLVLNINVPKHVNLSDPNFPPESLLPVLVWFHGGFFYRGSGTNQKLDGRWLSKAVNAVIVRVNYRVGPFGFLSFQDESHFVEGNQGLKDQQMALKWVQENIQAFGGDKHRVTIFANSAGSQAVTFHYLSSKSDPLFHRGILQSSPSVFAYQTPTESMNTITERVLKAIGCENNSSCLWTVEALNLTYARNDVINSSIEQLDLWGAVEPFRPVIDGVEFQDQPLNLFKRGMWQSHKEILLGTNAEEMVYISALFESIEKKLPRSLFEKINNKVLGKENGAIINGLYDDKGPPQDMDLSDNFAEEITDLFFVCPNRALARFAANTSTHPNKSVYLYNLAYPFSKENCVSTLTPVCGHAYHSSEEILVFKSPQGYGTSFTPDDSHVSDMFSTYWGGFANNGDPSSGLTVSLGDFATWPIYSALSSSSWVNMRLDVQESNQTKYREKYCDAWDQTGFYVNMSSSVDEVTTTAATTAHTSTTTTTSTTSNAITVKATKMSNSVCLLAALMFALLHILH